MSKYEKCTEHALVAARGGDGVMWGIIGLREACRE